MLKNIYKKIVSFSTAKTKMFAFDKHYDIEKYPKIYTTIANIVFINGGRQTSFASDYIDCSITTYGFEKEKGEIDIFINEFPGDLFLSSNNKEIFEKITKILDERLSREQEEKK